MAEKFYVGKKAMSFETSQKLPGYDMVILNLDENNYVSSPYATIDSTKWTSRENGVHTFTYDAASSRWVHNINGTDRYLVTTAGLQNTYGIVVVYSSVTGIKNGDKVTVSKSTVDGEVTLDIKLARSGSVLEFNCPLVHASQRQALADSILAQVIGHEYQPYTATGVHLNPAAEIGDAVTAYGIYGGIYSQSATYGRLMHSTIGAYSQEETDSEYAHKTSLERRYARHFADIETQFAIYADKIEASVSQTGGNQSFGWEMMVDHWSVLANGNTVFRIDASTAVFSGKVFANEIEVGTITIGGQTYNAGYVLGSQIGNGTIAGSNIGEYTVTGGYGGNLGYAGNGGLIGANIENATISTDQCINTIGSGVNGGLLANGCFSGSSPQPVWATTFRLNSTQYLEKTISFIDGNNQQRTYYVLARAGT